MPFARCSISEGVDRSDRFLCSWTRKAVLPGKTGWVGTILSELFSRNSESVLRGTQDICTISVLEPLYNPLRLSAPCRQGSTAPSRICTSLVDDRRVCWPTESSVSGVRRSNVDIGTVSSCSLLMF